MYTRFKIWTHDWITWVIKTWFDMRVMWIYLQMITITALDFTTAIDNTDAKNTTKTDTQHFTVSSMDIFYYYKNLLLQNCMNFEGRSCKPYEVCAGVTNVVPLCHFQYWHYKSDAILYNYLIHVFWIRSTLKTKITLYETSGRLLHKQWYIYTLFCNTR